MVRSHYHYTINSIPIIFLYHCDSSRFPQYSHYIYMVTPPTTPQCVICIVIYSIKCVFLVFHLSSSYIVITIQYLKALWGRPHRNTIDRRPKIKKTSGKQKTKQKKKQYFPTPLGSLHEKNKKNLEKTKKNKKKQYFQTLLGSLREKNKKTLRKPQKTKKTKKTIFSDSSGVTPWKNQKNLEKTKKTNLRRTKTKGSALFVPHVGKPRWGAASLVGTWQNRSYGLVWQDVSGWGRKDTYLVS